MMEFQLRNFQVNIYYKKVNRPYLHPKHARMHKHQYLFTMHIYVHVVYTSCKYVDYLDYAVLFIQTLTEGTKVTLTYELNRYTLKVLECKPSKGTHMYIYMYIPLFLKLGHLSGFSYALAGTCVHVTKSIYTCTLDVTVRF